MSPSGTVPTIPPGPPHAPGTSPFHVKGGVYQGTIKFFNEKLEGGVERLFRETQSDGEKHGVPPMSFNLEARWE